MTAFAQRTVTARLNTATIPDTTQISSLIEIRGAIDGNPNGAVSLPDGNLIDWNADSTIEPANVGGDYWDVTFQIPDDAELQFKFYSDQAQELGIDGWEAGGNHVIEAGTGDVDLGMHFFEHGSDRDYDWRPFESKADSVGVWFRVFMSTEDAVNKGFDRDGEMTIALRGDHLPDDQTGDSRGPLDWGANNVTLTREGGDASKPGYDLYSGVVYYHESLAGLTQAYKHFIVDVEGWEEGDDRTFTIPASDSTLRWVYYSNSAPAGEGPVTAPVLFAVDLDPLEAIGLFSRTRGDSLEVRGSFNSWDDANPDNSHLFKVPGEPIYEAEIPFTGIAGSSQTYKYFINFNVPAMQQEFGRDIVPSGWEEPLTFAGGNRTFTFEANQDGQILDERFGGIFAGNIIPDGVSVDVTFEVDMAPAVAFVDDPFDASVDTVTVAIEDPYIAFTQGWQLAPRDDDPNRGDGVDINTFARDVIRLTDDDQDGVFTGTLTINGPAYNGFQFRYAYGSQAEGYFLEPGTGTSAPTGRRRTKYIAPNADGSWPAVFTFGDATFETGDNVPLPFDPNPADPRTGTNIETVNGELPSNITLSQNYPNPFNPVTSFEYTIDRTMDVNVRIFDVMGREVAVLVDGVQQASSYRVNFDASQLASGVYVYQLQTPTQTLTKQMILLK
ncbi:MAG: hypothetical protein RhofKO_05380 [Rhodothermales bacterium]